MTISLPFNHSAFGSIGVELEWITVDQASGAQIAAAPALLASLSNTAIASRIKAELFASTIEINSDIHHDVTSCFAELAQLRRFVLAQPSMQGVGLLAAGTHPFSHWRDQQVSDDPRYHQLLQRMGWMARRFNIFGMHVHVGIGDGERCITALNALLPVMHLFLAISANSPLWHGDDTGLASSRLKVFEGLSQSGMPFYFENWQDFSRCVEQLQSTGSIDSIREIWWEMRPHPNFGTLEMRICDMPASFTDALALTALIRAEVMTAAAGITMTGKRVHPSLIRENRWRACRYGMDAIMIDPYHGHTVTLLTWLQQRLQWLSEQAVAFPQDLDIITQALPRWQTQGDGALRQRKQLQQCDGDLHSLVQQMRENDGWEQTDG